MLFSGPGVSPSLKGLTSNVINLEAGQTRLIQPAGWYYAKPGRYTVLQEYDPITTCWRSVGGGAVDANMQFFYSDGNNYRYANQTGCAVGALLTTAGSGYTSAPTVTPSAGSSIWLPIIGGAVNTTVTVTNGGTGYTYPPSVVFAAPPSPGVQATGYCTISGGVVTSVTITDQGAGYVTPPVIQFVNDPREVSNPNLSTGYNAAAIATLTGSGTITALLCLDHGTPLTSLPTLAFSGGGGSSAAATTIMDWTITSYTVTTAGAGLSGSVAWLTAEDAFPTTAPAYTNPTIQNNLVKTRKADIKAPLSTGAVTATGQVVYDGGIYTSAPNAIVIPNASVVTTAPVVALVMGGVADTSLLLTT